MAGPVHGDSLWRTTRVSMIRRAQDDSPGDGRDAAWRELIDYYRAPISVCLRRRVGRHSDCETIIDEFFGYLYSERVLDKLDHDRGRFRAFIQGVMQRFVLAKVREYQSAPGDAALEQELSPVSSAEIEVEEERAWARCILDRAIEQLLDSRPRDGEILLKSLGIAPYPLTPNSALARSYKLSLDALYKALERARTELRRGLDVQITHLVDGREAYEVERRALVGRLLEAQPKLLG